MTVSLYESLPSDSYGMWLGSAGLVQFLLRRPPLSMHSFVKPSCFLRAFAAYRVGFMAQTNGHLPQLGGAQPRPLAGDWRR